MLNFSRTPNRLEASPSLQKVILIFCTFWIAILIAHVLPTTDISKASAQKCHITDISSQEEEELLFSVGKCHTQIVESTVESSQFKEALSIAKEQLERALLPIPMELYLHSENNLSSKFHWVPVVLEKKLSGDDILVDLTYVINPELSYELSAYHQHITSLLVERESGNQPFIGQLLVAEDIIGRMRSGLYGSDIDSILMHYLAKREEDGKLHVYLGDKEFLEASPSAQKAVELALSGSQVSYFLLQAVTELRNEQYEWDLDDTYYKWGALFHFAPKRILHDPIAVRNRRFSKIPVSFQYYEHIFYGRWDYFA